MTPSTTRPASTHTRLWISKQSSRLVRWAVTEQLLPESGVVIRIRDKAGRGTAGAATIGVAAPEVTALQGLRPVAASPYPNSQQVPLRWS